MGRAEVLNSRCVNGCDNEHENFTQSSKPPRSEWPDQEAGIMEILRDIGEDVEREGLLDTPYRFVKAFKELTGGYRIDPREVVNGALFESNYDDIVIVKDIDFSSLCEHHLLPFIGKAHVAYIPNGKIIGLSKIPRIVEVFSKRLQVQERLTQEIADFLCQITGARGVGVVIESSHMCSMIRGVRKKEALMTTQSLHGDLKDDLVMRSEFLNHIRN